MIPVHPPRLTCPGDPCTCATPTEVIETVARAIAEAQDAHGPSYFPCQCGHEVEFGAGWEDRGERHQLLALAAAAVAAYRATQDGGAEGLVWVQLPADDVSFLAGFDPDRDRTASRADMVRVMEHLRAALDAQAEEAGQ
jgi:hypothetical protein